MTRISLLVAACLAVFMIQPAHAQTPDRDWNTQCRSDSCTLSRKLRSTEQNSIVTTFFAVVERTSETVRLGAIIPLGVAVSPGIRFEANGQIFELPVEVCYPDGCRAQREFTEDEATVIVTAGDLRIQFIPYTQGTPIFVRMPTEGLNSAITNAQESFQ